jgi:hypothetical protein
MQYQAYYQYPSPWYNNTPTDTDYSREASRLYEQYYDAQVPSDYFTRPPAPLDLHSNINNNNALRSRGPANELEAIKAELHSAKARKVELTQERGTLLDQIKQLHKTGLISPPELQQRLGQVQAEIDFNNDALIKLKQAQQQEEKRAREAKLQKKQKSQQATAQQDSEQPSFIRTRRGGRRRKQQQQQLLLPQPPAQPQAQGQLESLPMQHVGLQVPPPPPPDIQLPLPPPPPKQPPQHAQAKQRQPTPSNTEKSERQFVQLVNRMEKLVVCA